jgi:hypothetical protein
VVLPEAYQVHGAGPQLHGLAARSITIARSNPARQARNSKACQHSAALGRC